MLNWLNLINFGVRKYQCGYCGQKIASEKAYVAERGYDVINICPYCTMPTIFLADGSQIPGILYGDEVQDISDKDVVSLYKEARECIASNAYTASVMCSRKLLMNIAVAKGAKEGLSYKDYVDYLASKGFVPPDGKEWVDHIRNKGNEANHEIALMTEKDAKELIDFLSMLLKLIFEFPALAKKKTTP